MIIYAIPGLGTTEKLFVNLQISGVEIIVLKWPISEKEDTMITYARKFLPQINTEQPFCLLGVSFGGMLCVELSKILSPKKVFLISTCKTKHELPWFIRGFKYVPFHDIISEKQYRKMAYLGRSIIGFGKAFVPEFLAMVNSMKENYFKNCIHIITNWDRDELPKNSVHIHGNADKLLLYKNVKADYTIEKGSHAMIVFQAEEINKIIEKELKIS